MIKIDAYRTDFDEALWQVYYTAIRQVCVNHYSRPQIEAWAPDGFDRQIFSNKMQELKPYVASIGDVVVGYADLQTDGYIDHFYVHGDYQRQGVGNALMARILLEGKAYSRLYSNVSNTAKPFFEKYEFYVVKKQLIEVRGQHLENSAMELVPRAG